MGAPAFSTCTAVGGRRVEVSSSRTVTRTNRDARSDGEPGAVHREACHRHGHRHLSSGSGRTLRGHFTRGPWLPRLEPGQRGHPGTRPQSRRLGAQPGWREHVDRQQPTPSQRANGPTAVAVANEGAIALPASGEASSHASNGPKDTGQVTDIRDPVDCNVRWVSLFSATSVPVLVVAADLLPALRVLSVCACSATHLLPAPGRARRGSRRAVRR